MNKPLYSRWHMLAAFALLLLSINLSAQAWQQSYLTTVGFTLQTQVFLTKTDANGKLNAPPTSCNGNLITNPGYENGLADWSSVGTATIVTDAYSGSKAAKLGGDGYSSIGMIFPTTPGKNYNFSVWAKSVGPFSYQAVTIRFLNSSYAVIPTLGTGDLSIGSSYTNATYQVTAPAGAVYVYALAYKDGPGGLLVDDWCLVEQGSTFLPDLVVSNIQVLSALNTGVPFNFSCMAKNNGLAPAPACNLHISLGSGLHIGNLPVPPLAVGQETTLNGQFDLPGGAGFGSGVVQAEIDLPDNAVQESNEINNGAVSSVVSLNNTVSCTGSVGTPICSDNGTPANPADDQFSFYINVGTSVQNPPFTAWTTTVNGQLVTGNFGTPALAGPFPISLGTQGFTVSGYQCTLPLTVNPPAPCSNGSGTGQIDLSLGLQQLTASPAQWSNYQVKATLSNAGPEAATGVKVKFAKPNGVVYVGGNEYSSSPGTFNPNGDEVWTVGSIPANGTATLTVNYFLLQATVPVAYAQVMAQNETDGDSQPNNGTPPTPVQDDEASTAGGSPPTLLPDLTIADLQIPNTSVSAGTILGYNFDAGNAGTAAVPSNFTIKSYISTDQTLSANDVQDGTIQTGNFGIGYSSQNVVAASTIPPSLAAGQYYLIVKIDGDDAIVEGNENNNMVVKPFTVTSGGSSDPSADLSLSMVMSSNTLTTSGTLNITAKLTNNGPDEATNINVKTSFGNASNIFQFISVFALDGAYYPANGEWHVTALAAGSTYTLHLTVKAATPPFVGVANAYAKVEDVDQNDPDSTPGNDDPTEDDYVQESVTITNAGTPCDDVTITPATGQITIAGVVAPHHILKVFRPDWSIAFQCVDCATPQTITGLGPGSHFVEVKLINAGWSEICKETEYVGVTNIVGQQDPRQRISFDRVYPNPAKYTVNLEVYSPEDQSAVLDFYDQQGRVVYSLNAELEEGTNNVQVFVFDWKSGTYNVIARGEKTGLPAYGRFLKVWEE